MESSDSGAPPRECNPPSHHPDKVQGTTATSCRHYSCHNTAQESNCLLTTHNNDDRIMSLSSSNRLKLEQREQCSCCISSQGNIIEKRTSSWIQTLLSAIYVGFSKLLSAIYVVFSSFWSAIYVGFSRLCDVLLKEITTARFMMFWCFTFGNCVSTSRKQKCPPECECNDNLTTIDCSGRDVVAAPRQLPDMTSYFNMSRNNIVTLQQSSFDNLKLLKTLDLSYNQLEDFRIKLSSLTSLQYLDLSNNRLQKIPFIFYKSTKSLSLTQLRLRGNPIKKINFFVDFLVLMELKILDIGQLQQLETIETRISLGLIKLEILQMDKCDRLVTIPDFYFSNLQSLTISSINFKQIPANSFSRLSNLQVIRITDSNINNVDENAFVNNPKLKSIDLSGNNLSSLPRNLLKNNKFITSLLLQDNSWNCDCRLDWLRRKLRDICPTMSTTSISCDVKCSSPKKFSSFYLNSKWNDICKNDGNSSSCCSNDKFVNIGGSVSMFCGKNNNRLKQLNFTTDSPQQQLQNFTTVQVTTATVPTTFTTYNNYVEWKLKNSQQNGKVVNNNSTGGYNRIKITNTGTLRITNVTTADSGRYDCTSNNGNTTVYLTVVKPIIMGTTKPKIIKSSSTKKNVRTTKWPSSSASSAVVTPPSSVDPNIPGPSVSRVTTTSLKTTVTTLSSCYFIYNRSTVVTIN